MSSPYKSAKDSPSKQLLWELGQKARLEQELFYAHLDRENDEREALHRQALAAASAEHDRVRRNAEQYREQLERQIQADRARREEETQQEIEKLRKAKAEQEIAASRREAERAKAEEADQKRLAELKQLQDAEAGRRKLDKERQDAEAALNAQRLKQQADERLKREQEAKAVEARAKEAAILSETSSRAALHTNPTIPANQQLAPIPGTTRNQQWEAEHQSYLEIHQRLKDLRKFMTAQAKQSPELKRAMGDMRREMKKSVGQLREGKGANKIPVCRNQHTLGSVLTFFWSSKPS